MYKSIFILLAVVFSSYTARCQLNSTIITNQSDLIFETIDAYDLASLPNREYTDEIGAPQLPLVVKEFLLPVNAEVTNIIVNNTSYQIL